MSSARQLAAAALAALLAACGGDAPQEGEVSGEVLEGTISDAMLPLDQVRSEAPLADPTGTGSGRAPVADDAPAPDGEAETAPEADADEPAADEPTEADE